MKKMLKEYKVTYLLNGLLREAVMVAKNHDELENFIKNYYGNNATIIMSEVK